jgi:hypothetical protein
MKRTLLLSAFVVLSSLAFAGEPSVKQAPSKEFELVKGLVGDWKGTADMQGKPMETTTSFHLTAAGSAVVETMDAGTPHEMTNVYHDVDGKLVMTHYCAIGNAPEMKVEKADDHSIAFQTIKANGIDPKTTPHMHSLAFDWTDKDHLTATWTSANMGKEHEGPSVFKYARVADDKSSK